ncbi:MAG: pseudouridine synthase [Pseudomonadota bacterium]
MSTPPESSRPRLARAISQSGLTSRRAADRLVAEGAVTVNGQVVTDPGAEVDPQRDTIRVEGRTIGAPPVPQYLVMYKPRGYLTGRDDPEGRTAVHELLPASARRLEPVGRLDFNTEGALLFTNDGELAHRLTHPSYHVPRRYLAKVYRTPSEATLDKIRKGIRLDDGRTVPALCRVMEGTDTGNAWVEITVYEGRHHLVRRLFAALGHPVSKLRRETFATVSIRGMERGQVRPLTGEEIERLRALTAEPGPAGRPLPKQRTRKGWAKASKPKIRKSRAGKAPAGSRKGRGVRS